MGEISIDKFLFARRIIPGAGTLTKMGTGKEKVRRGLRQCSFEKRKARNMGVRPRTENGEKRAEKMSHLLGGERRWRCMLIGSWGREKINQPKTLRGKIEWGVVGQGHTGN